MKQRKTPIQLISRVLLLGLCLLFAMSLWSYKENETVPNHNKQTTQQQTQPAEQTFVDNEGETNVSFPDVTEFDGIIERPLFNETRQPFIPPPPEPKKTIATPTKKEPIKIEKETELSLSAVVISPTKQIAILQSKEKKELERLSPGESINGWTLEDISSHSIQLKKGEQIRNLELQISGSATPAPRPRTEENNAEESAPQIIIDENTTEVDAEPAPDTKIAEKEPEQDR